MPSPRSGSPPGEIEVAVRTDSYSVTATTPGAGSSMTSMIVVLTGISTACLLSNERELCWQADPDWTWNFDLSKWEKTP